jgi:hypothetical protein
MLYPCACRNSFVQSIKVVTSSTPTSSASVLDLVVSFCFREMDIGTPVPYDMAPPVWLQKSLWTANEASTYHLMTCRSSAARNSTSSVEPLRYSIRRNKLSQSFSVGSCTRVHRKAIVVCISGLARLHANSPFATKV